MEDFCDLMLAYWWVVKHKAKGLAEGGKISFESKQPKMTCRRHNCNSFTIETDVTILDFGVDPRLIEFIRNLKFNDKNEIETDWIDRIPWQYRDFKSLYN
jgi:hypothetical protein